MYSYKDIEKIKRYYHDQIALYQLAIISLTAIIALLVIIILN